MKFLKQEIKVHIFLCDNWPSANNVPDNNSNVLIVCAMCLLGYWRNKVIHSFCSKFNGWPWNRQKRVHLTYVVWLHDWQDLLNQSNIFICQVNLQSLTKSFHSKITNDKSIHNLYPITINSNNDSKIVIV